MEEIKNPLEQSPKEASVELSIKNPAPNTNSKKKSPIEFLKSYIEKFKALPSGKKTLVLVILIIVFLLISSGIAYAFIQLSANRRFFRNDGNLIGKDGDSDKDSLDAPRPDDIKDQESPINGVLYTRSEMDELKTRYPLAIVVENHPDARPQSGLDKADVVYEFLAEGGITRLLPIYWGEQSKEIGPVRSARKYMIDMLGEYEALFMHLGWAEGTGNTNTDSASYISSTGTRSFLWGGYYWRSSDKVAPHNVYTETTKLWEQAEGKGWTTEEYTTSSWKFKNDLGLDDRPLTSNVDVSFGSNGALYNVKWTYDRDSNSYKRSLAGGQSIDKVTGIQLEAKNVIVQEVVKTYPEPRDDKARIILDIIGEGKVTIFNDGKSVEGTWKKTSRTSKTRFYDRDGEEIKLNRGKIWIEMIPVYNGRLEGSLSYN